MLDLLRKPILRLLRVPPEPRVPAGDEIRVFRASPRFFGYRLVLWGLAQIGMLAVLGAITYWGVSSDGPWYMTAGPLVAGVAYIVQLPITLTATWLDWDQRWYIVSDRSLRIRERIVRVSEKTMTFANIQQISIRRNPLQTLLGIADVRVRTAGGGDAGDSHDLILGDSLHEAFFRGVDNAEEIRTTIRDRVRLYRGSGVGDPEDGLLESAAAGAESGLADPTNADEAVLAAVHEVRDEVAKLRAARRAMQAPGIISPGPGA